VKVLLVNILGGITHCDDVARGIVQAKTALKSTCPIVVRLVGTNEEEGRRILGEAEIQVLDSMEDAAQIAVKLAKSKLSR
jgi:succinyl-CoA synthetase beta subunit